METLSPAVIHALSIGNLPDVQWKHGDDLCDCMFQRIMQFTNPYIGVTHEERLCCIWAKLHEQYPDLSRDIPASWDINAQEWVTEPQEWNGEEDMPMYLWVRHVARRDGITVAEAREVAGEAPRGVPRPVVEPEPQFDPIEGLMLLVAELTRKVEALEAR